MKTREFQRVATVKLMQKLMEVCMEQEKRPNLTVCSQNYSSYIKLKKDYNFVQIAIKQTGEISYELTDMLGSTGGNQVYYEYRMGDDLEQVMKKFIEDFGRLYQDFLLAGTLHDFDDMKLSYDIDTDDALACYEEYIAFMRKYQMSDLQ